LSASLAVYSVLPSSLQAEALTNPGAAASAISAEFATATPTWFSELSPDIQTYLLGQGATTTALVALSTGLSGSNITATGIYSNTTITSSGAAASSSAAKTTGAAAGTTSGKASTSSSTGGASMPTQVIGAGLAGAIGLIGMLAL